MNDFFFVKLKKITRQSRRYAENSHDTAAFQAGLFFQNEPFTSCKYVTSKSRYLAGEPKHFPFAKVDVFIVEKLIFWRFWTNLADFFDI